MIGQLLREQDFFPGISQNNFIEKHFIVKSVRPTVIESWTGGHAPNEP